MKMILVIDKSRREAAIHADVFHYMGILACGVCPEDAFSEIGIEYRCVTVVCPELIPDVRSYVKRLRQYASVTPIFALTKQPTRELIDTFDCVLDLDIQSSTFIKRLTEFCRQRSLPYSGSYLASGIDASADVEGVFYGNREIPLTKTEKMILRFLVRCYPRTCSPKSILKHAFKQTRAPLVTSVRTHVSQINKKFRETAGIIPIRCEESVGYFLDIQKT